MLRRRRQRVRFGSDPVDEVQERAFGLCALLTLNGHVDLWGRSEVLGHQTRLHHQNEQRKNDGDHDFLPPRICVIGITCSFLPRLGMRKK